VYRDFVPPPQLLSLEGLVAVSSYGLACLEAQNRKQGSITLDEVGGGIDKLPAVKEIRRKGRLGQPGPDLQCNAVRTVRTLTCMRHRSVFPIGHRPGLVPRLFPMSLQVIASIVRNVGWDSQSRMADIMSLPLSHRVSDRCAESHWNEA